MARIRIILGNEPRAYRDALAAALPVVRSDLDVVVVQPADLDREAARLAPQLVIGSHLSEATRAVVPAWLDLYPAGASMVVGSVGGQRLLLGDINLDTLLSIIARLG